MDAKYLAALAPGIGGRVVRSVFRSLGDQLSSLYVGPPRQMTIAPGETAELKIRQMIGAHVSVVELQTPPSVAFPRVARPRVNGGSFADEWTNGYTRQMASPQQQLGALADF